MNYREIHNMVIELRFTDRHDLAFQAAVFIAYGLLNNTTSKNGIRKEVGYCEREVDFIYHNLLANGIISAEQWRVDLSGGNQEIGMEIMLCAMAACGDIVRFDEKGSPAKADEKPINWSDLYNTPYEAGELILFTEEQLEEWKPIIRDEEFNQWQLEERKKWNSRPKKEDVFPLPARHVRINYEGRKIYVRPKKLEGRTVTGNITSDGKEITFDVSEIIKISGLRKSIAEELKDLIIGPIEPFVIPERKPEKPYEFFIDHEIRNSIK